MPSSLHSIDYTKKQLKMSFYDVLARGDDALDESPRRSRTWNFFSHITCNTVVGLSKIVLNTLYNVEVKGLENLDQAMVAARKENRGILTLMNHMSTCDDPFIWACLPWRYFKDLDDIRWGMAASNVCFTSKVTSRFFSMGKILSCERFGRGPFQPALDACVRILSPDNTLDSEHIFHGLGPSTDLAASMAKNLKEERNLLSPEYKPPVLRKKTSLLHIFPEGFVCQLRPPFNNSMRFFRWGTARMILEPTVAPTIVPIFSDGFEKIKPEKVEESAFDFFTFYNRGGKVTVNIGKPLDAAIIDGFRDEWRKLCLKYTSLQDSNRMSDELKFGEEAKRLRSKVSGYLREQVSKLRLQNGFDKEDSRFSDVNWWVKYTDTKGKSDPSVKFVGLNWACRDYQSNVKIYDEKGNLLQERKDAICGPKAPKKSH